MVFINGATIEPGRPFHHGPTSVEPATRRALDSAHRRHSVSTPGFEVPCGPLAGYLGNGLVERPICVVGLSDAGLVGFRLCVDGWPVTWVGTMTMRIVPSAAAAVDVRPGSLRTGIAR